MIKLPDQPYRFDSVVLDPSNLRLTVSGAVRQLEPKSFRLLQFLIENHGRIVSKDEILRVVWEDVAVTDNALTRAVAQIRKALDDDPKTPRYIETVPTVGYRFIAEFRQMTEDPKKSSIPAPAIHMKEPVGYRRYAWAGITTLVLIAGLIFWFLTRGAPPVRTSMRPAVPLTGYPGFEISPSFSPDGNQVAFVWDGSTRDNYDIYVKQVGTDAPLRLTTDPAADIDPNWSPDGRAISFVRALPENRFEVMVMPALGGPEQRVGQFISHLVKVHSDYRFSGYIAWTADSRSLIVSGDTDPDGYADRLFLLSVETKEVTPLTYPLPQWSGDRDPAVSPDGRSLLFTRWTGFAVTEINRLSLSADLKPAGEPVRFPIEDLFIRAPVWTADGKDFLFVGTVGTWRMSASGQEPPVRVEALGRDDITPALSARGDRLAVAHAIADTNIWRLDLQQQDAKPQRLIDSTAREAFPQYSPDGKRIVFYSDRTGTLQIWICDNDGSRAFPLTSFTGATGTPRWSPDGQMISFDSNMSGQWNVYTVSSDGGKPRMMTNDAGPISSYAASWSRDGRWLYFTSNRSGENQVWRMPSNGGEPMQVTRNGGIAAMESPDGATLFYVKDAGTGSIWKMPVNGDSETQLATSVYRFNYAATDRGIYFSPRPGKEGGASVQFLDFASGELKTIISTGFPDLGLAISPDGRYLLFEQVDYAASDLSLIEGFR